MPTLITGTTISSTAISGSSFSITGGTQGFITPTTGSAPYSGARAWVNFNGTGTIAIRASSNVSSLVVEGIGRYAINFSTAMPDANYALTGIPGNGDNVRQIYTTTYTSSQVGVGIYNFATSGASDPAQVCVVIHR